MDNRKTFSVDKVGFPSKQIKEMKDKYGVKIVVIIEGAIQARPNDPVYEHAKSMDVFIKSPSGLDDFVGRQWPGDVHYLDFLNPNTRRFYSHHLKILKENLHFDGYIPLHHHSLLQASLIEPKRLFI